MRCVLRWVVLSGGHGSCLRCGESWSHTFWRFHTQTFANLQQCQAKRVTGLTRFSRRQVGNSGLPTASFLRKLTLRDSLFGYSRDVVFPLHASDYIGLPIFYQAEYRYRNSVCYAQ